MEKVVDKFCKILKSQLPKLTEEYKVKSLGLFGSYVHDHQEAESDLDILVTFNESPGLITFLQLENYLSDLLGVKVDLVMKNSLKPRIGEKILNEVISL